MVLENQIESARKLQIPSLFILGPLTDINQFNNSQDIVSISGTNKTTSEATPIIKPGFNQFILSDQSLDYINKLPPLNAPLGIIVWIQTHPHYFIRRLERLKLITLWWYCQIKALTDRLIYWVKVFGNGN